MARLGGRANYSGFTIGVSGNQCSQVPFSSRKRHLLIYIKGYMICGTALFEQHSRIFPEDALLRAVQARLDATSGGGQPPAMEKWLAKAQERR
jgi:hypothetical protein